MVLERMQLNRLYFADNFHNYIRIKHQFRYVLCFYCKLGQKKTIYIFSKPISPEDIQICRSNCSFVQN